jgi:hypothetical protein
MALSAGSAYCVQRHTHKRPSIRGFQAAGDTATGSGTALKWRTDERWNRHQKLAM